MHDEAIRRTFNEAVEELVGHLKQDRAILAAILCGSLSHDTVWEGSDVDLVLVTIDDRKVPHAGLTLDAAGINVHAILMPRAEFRKTAEGAIRNSFSHSLLAKGRLLYTHDPTITDLCAGLSALGARDARIQMLRAATGALPAIDKAHKWLVTRGDLEYTALWILHAATPIARIEVIAAGRLADREVIPQALTLNPELFGTIYRDLLNSPKTHARVQAALDAVDGYIAERAATLFEPILEYLQEAGEPRSSTELETHFKRQFDVEGVTTACEYLARRRLIGRASTPVRLTKRSTADVQELAFFALDAGTHAR